MNKIVNNTQDNRIESISQMFIEMAKGNFRFRIKGADQGDELDAMIMRLNMLAEELEAASGQDGTSMTFILTQDFTIEISGPEVKQALLFDAHELEGKPFSALLTDYSKEEWESIKPHITNPGDHETLNYFSEQSKTFRFPCLVSFLQIQAKSG